MTKGPVRLDVAVGYAVPRTGVPLKPPAKAAASDALPEDDVGVASGAKQGGGE